MNVTLIDPVLDGVVSIPAALCARAAESPDAIALIDGATGTSWSRAEVVERTAVAAHALAGHGVRPGDRVALSCEPSAAVVIVFLALLRMGATVVPANTAYTAREVAHIATDAAPVAVVIDDLDRAVRWREVGVELALDPHALLSADVDANGGATVDLPLDHAGGDDPAMVGYTSGTTGVPKGAVLNHRNLFGGAASVVEAWEWSSADTLVLSLPLFHMHGLGVGVNGSVVSGGACVVLPRFDVDAVIDALTLHDASLFFGVPTMYARLARSPRVSELARLRVAVSGSAPLPPSVWQRLNDAADVQVLERYGMTETVMLASNPLRGERRAGTVGLPLPGVELRLGAGDVVEVRGGNVFSGYLGRPDATAEAFTADGWFRTGDVGAIDADGYLALVGRSSELIISGGFNIYPREVEDALRGHPFVQDVAVVGTPDEEWGEIVTAFVVLDGGALTAAGVSDSDEWIRLLTEHAADGVARFKVPRQWCQLDALPRNAMGKVVRTQLVLPPTAPDDASA